MKRIYRISLFISILFLITSCYKDFTRFVVGNGKITTETRILSNFEKVSSSGNFEVEIIYDTLESKVEVEAESNIIPFVVTEIHGKELQLGLERFTQFSTRTNVKIKVYTKSLQGVSMSGSGSISTDEFEGNDFEAHLSGSGDLSFQFTGNTSHVFLSGSGKLSARGKVISSEFNISGSAHVEALDMETENTWLDISGSGHLKVYATKTLNARISGSGEVYYKGSPLVTKEISGSGKLLPW